MKELPKRSAYWDQNYTRFDSIHTTKMMEDNLELFRGSTVLEIGPGEGRQFIRVSHLAKSYAVADIAPFVLGMPVFAPTRRMLITDYATNSWDWKFDVIHFWYLIHHVRLEELGDFFKFLHDHLADSGVVLFNYPRRETYGDDLRNDGTGTSPILDDHITKGIAPWFDLLERWTDESPGERNSVSVMMKGKP